jgi:hypothetical protein
MINLQMVDGDLINRCELFDEADLVAALARFDELSRPAPQLENAASRAYGRLQTYFAARDWDATAQAMADNYYSDDRRRVVGAGVRHGRDAAIENYRAIADVGLTSVSSTAIAIRGQRLAVMRFHLLDREAGPEPFRMEVLVVTEIDADERIAAVVVFDLDDIDAAVEELEARYLAGEGIAHSHTWSVIAGGYAEFNRRQLSPTTPDWVNIDHRRGGSAFAPGEQIAYINASWEDTPDIRIHVEAVHRLSDLGAVVTQAVHGTSHEGFEAEWREIHVVTLEGALFNRSEMFDEADLDAALAHFDGLRAPAAQFENAATRARAHTTDAFNRRDSDGFVALMNPDGRSEDRRKGLRDDAAGVGLRKVVHALFEAPKSYRLKTESVAIRGARLGLTRDTYRDTSDPDRAITAEHLTLIEVGVDNLVCNTVLFDPDDINSAIAELTARWIASGEVAHPEVIESVCRISEAVNRHDWEAFEKLCAGATYVSHRQLSSRVQTIADLMSSFRTMESLAPDYWVEFAEVLTYSAMGLVGDCALRGTSTDGLAIEIPLVMLLVVDRNRATGFEAFDPGQRDLALTRFEELNLPI